MSYVITVSAQGSDLNVCVCIHVCLCVRSFICVFVSLFVSLSVKSECFWVSDSVSITVCLTLGCVRRRCLWKTLSSLRPPPPCRNGACCGSNSTWSVSPHFSLGNLCLALRKHWLHLNATYRVRRVVDQKGKEERSCTHPCFTYLAQKIWWDIHFYLQYAVFTSFNSWKKHVYLQKTGDSKNHWGWTCCIYIPFPWFPIACHIGCNSTLHHLILPM